MYTLHKALIRLFLFTVALSFFCRAQETPSAELAITLVQQQIHFSGNATAQALTDGLSQAKIYKITTNKKSYVLRFISHKPLQERINEISVLTLAAQVGYGPKIIAAHSEQGFIIMEFLQQEERTASPEFSTALAHLLQKIHTGPTLSHSVNFFVEVEKNLANIYARPHNNIPLSEIKDLIHTITPVLKKHIKSAPCHNDLNPNNIFFCNKKCLAIDYESAAQSDPYVDIATVVTAFCYSPEEEASLLSSYLERTPTEKELAKLSLMKQMVLINYALIGLKKYTGNISRYQEVEEISLQTLFRLLIDGSVNAKNPYTFLIFAKTMLTHVFEVARSKSFLHALEVLK